MVAGRADGRPTAVVFDLGGVLIDWNPRYLFRQLIADPADLEAFLDEVDLAAWNHQLDAGRPWAEAVEAAARAHPHRRELIEAFWRRWPETLGEAIPGTHVVLDDLRAAGVRVLALSNWSAETFPIARERFGFLDGFEAIVLSGDVGVAKPDPRIFEHLIRAHGVDPAAAVYVDDLPANVAAAERLGFRGVRFTDAAALRGELVEIGLLRP